MSLRVRARRQRIDDDLGDARAGTIGHQHDLVGEVDRLVDVVRDHEHGLAGLAGRCCAPRPAACRASARRAPRTARPSAGSSDRSTSARAMPTRCFMPPESSAGLLRSAAGRGRPARWPPCALAVTSARDHFGHRDAPHRRRCRAPISTAAARGSGRSPRGRAIGPSIALPSTMTTPDDGASRPARMLSTVVLPQPEWPMTADELAAAHRQPEVVEDRRSRRRRAPDTLRECPRSRCSGLRHGSTPER